MGPGNGNVPGTPMSTNTGAVPYDDDEEFQLADLSMNSAATGSPESQRNVRYSMNATPRGRRSASALSMRSSIGKRAGTPAAEFLRWSERDTPVSPEKTFDESRDEEEEEDLDFEFNDETLSDGGFDGLENVRACCDGRHTVGGHHHHDHHDHEHPHGPPRPPRPPSRSQSRMLNVSEGARPISPSGWSLRSRSGSVHSQGVSGLFSRFGSRRSAKTPVDR